MLDSVWCFLVRGQNFGFLLNILSHSSELFIVNASSLFSPILTSLRVPSAENAVPPPRFSQDGVNLKSCAKILSK